MEAKNNTLIKCIVVYLSFALLISIGVHAASVVKGILLHPEDGEVNPTIEAYVDGVIKPTIYWDTVLEKWSFSHDGVKSSVFGSGGGGSRLNLMENSSFEEGEEGTCTFCSMSTVPSFLATPSNENALQVVPELGGGTWGRHIDHDAIYSGVEGLISFWIQTDHIVDGIFFVDGDQIIFQVEPNVKPQYFEYNFKMGSVSIGLDLWGDNPFLVDEIYMGANVTEDLQRAYERSDGGKISINNELGAIKIIDETGVTNTPLLKILSNDELVEYFSVKDQQTIVGNELLIKDKIAFQNGGAEIFSTSFMSPDIYGAEAPTGSLVLSNNNLHIKQSQLDDYDWAKVAHAGNFNEFANSHLNAFENPGFEAPNVYDVLGGTGQRVLKNKSVTPYDKYALQLIPTSPTFPLRWSIEENSGSFTGQEIIVGCQAWSDNPTATLTIFKDSFEVFQTSITSDAQGYYIPLIGGSTQHRVSISALDGDPIWVDNCFAGTLPIGSGGGVAGSRLNLIEHPSFEKGMIDEIVCTNATAEIEETVVLKTANNKKSVKITATDDNAFCIVDKAVDSNWDASIDIVKFAWFKTDAVNASFVSRIDGNDEDLQKSIYPTDRWHSLKLRTTSGTTSNGYKINLATSGDIVYLDEQEIRPLNSSDQLTRDDVWVQQDSLTYPSVLNVTTDLSSLSSSFNRGEGIYELSSSGITLVRDAEIYLSVDNLSTAYSTTISILVNGEVLSSSTDRDGSSDTNRVSTSLSLSLEKGDVVTFSSNSGASGGKINIFAKESKPINVVEDKVELTAETSNELAASINSIGSIVSTNYDWISSCTWTSAGVLKCNLNTDMELSTQLSCTCTVNYISNTGTCTTDVAGSSTTSLIFRSRLLDGTLSSLLLNIKCSKVGDDVNKSLTVNAKLKASNIKGGVDYGVENNLIAGYASFGGATDGSVCSSSPCTRYREVGELAENMSVVRIGTGVYELNVTGLKPNSSISCTCEASTPTAANLCYMKNDTFQTDISGNAAIIYASRHAGSENPTVDSFTSVNCKGPRP